MGFDEIDKRHRPAPLTKLECASCDSTDDVQTINIQVFPIGDPDMRPLCVDCRKDRQAYIDRANG